MRALGVTAAAIVIGLLTFSDIAQAAISQCVSTPGVPGLCSSSASPCLVTGPVSIAPGKVIDCHDIDVTLTNSGVITVNPGSFTLIARDLTIDQGRRIEAIASTAVPVGIEIDLSGKLTLNGQLIAQNKGRGSHVAVVAEGPITLGGANPAIDVSGQVKYANGGQVFLASRGNVVVGKRIDANGRDGGDEYDINFGGPVAIDALGNVDINEEIRLHGHWLGGGRITVVAGGSISITDTPNSNYHGKINAEGRWSTAGGGDVELVAGNGVLLSGPIVAPGGINNTGGESAGGSLSVIAGCGGITMEDAIDLTGGEAGGGVLVASADGPITLSGTIDARSRKLGGDGGVVMMSSGKLLRLTTGSTTAATITVDGNNTPTVGEDGEGGLILLAGCQVSIDDSSAAGPQLTATGYIGGGMSFEGSKTPLGPAESSVHVGDKSLVDTTGESVPGGVYLEVGLLRSGVCSNNFNVSCTQNSQCIFGGCNSGTCGCPDGSCQKPNPETDGVVTQFHPAPVSNQTSTLLQCSSSCP